MDYNELLRLAHIASIKQKYLDAIEQARQRLLESERAYYDGAQEAYIGAELERRGQAQRLRAAGLSGGAGEEAALGTGYDYQNEMSRLRSQRQSGREAYAREAAKQTRLMDNAVGEYSAQLAKTAAKKSGSSSKAKSEAQTSQTEQTQGDDEYDYVGMWRKKVAPKSQ